MHGRPAVLRALPHRLRLQAGRELDPVLALLLLQNFATNRPPPRLHSGGGRLVRLEFPRVEIQSYGDVAVIYSQYIFETEAKGERKTSSGRATEVFLRKNGRWINPGWHMDSGK